MGKRVSQNTTLRRSRPEGGVGGANYGEDEKVEEKEMCYGMREGTRGEVEKSKVGKLQSR